MDLFCKSYITLTMTEIILQYGIFNIKLSSSVRNNQDSEISLTIHAGTHCEPRLFTNLDLFKTHFCLKKS
jgi:hypothetical protein